MPMSPEEFCAHAIRAADGEGRLPLSRVTGDLWESSPVWLARLWPCLMYQAVTPLRPMA